MLTLIKRSNAENKIVQPRKINLRKPKLMRKVQSKMKMINQIVMALQEAVFLVKHMKRKLRLKIQAMLTHILKLLLTGDTVKA